VCPFHETPPFAWIVGVHWEEEGTEGEFEQVLMVSDRIGITQGEPPPSVENNPGKMTFSNLGVDHIVASIAEQMQYDAERLEHVTASGFVRMGVFGGTLPSGNTNVQFDYPYSIDASSDYHLVEGTGAISSFTAIFTDFFWPLGVVGSDTASYGTITFDAYVHPTLGPQGAHIWTPIEFVMYAHTEGPYAVLAYWNWGLTPGGGGP